MISVAAAFAATFVSAQPVIDTSLFPEPKQVLLADLTGDGVDDKLQIFPLNERFDVLSFAIGSGTRFRDEEAIILPINLSEWDSLEQLPNGNIAIHWGCFACGRTHDHYSVTVRYEDYQLQIIGYDTSYADRLYAAVFTCSVNFLSGRAIVKAVGVEKLELPSAIRPVPLAEFDFSHHPPACDALQRYDEAFLEEHFPQPED